MNKIASIHPNGYFLLAAESKRQWKISYLFRFVTSAHASNGDLHIRYMAICHKPSHIQHYCLCSLANDQNNINSLNPQ